MNYASLLKKYEEELIEIGEDKENISYVFKELKNWSAFVFFSHQTKEVNSADAELLRDIMIQLKKHLSPQYIVGKAYFRDFELKVDQRVLIPRPETEELVDLILKENPKTEVKVLDIGTGSGVIAIALKKEKPRWTVHASDISPDALVLAKENANYNQVEVSFLQSDVFSSISEKYDIIVSNPPYISRADKNEVGKNVLASEPHLALFADEEGFAIYRQIIENAGKFLKSQGKLYFEIGYKQSAGITKLVEEHFPQKRFRILKDFYGKDRMVVIDDKGI
ncbi:peptide chain release factor N(5)-glutamine methyltransferase [Streptococcus catagoni]|uniref:peptide chain release factor N(5)-glutamine methyltransferase n=1 Tax=Streptococcus catagoni TaxID=2654874 RepID=UPI00140ABB06|nr:peptide chain release factor N(5)-glutamine methyltransferase [Streptococcus catagoni]